MPTRLAKGIVQVRLPSRGSSFWVSVCVCVCFRVGLYGMLWYDMWCYGMSCIVCRVPNGWFGGIGRNRMMQSRKRLSVQGLRGNARNSARTLEKKKHKGGDNVPVRWGRPSKGR